MPYAALVRPALDRVYSAMRTAARERCRRVSEQTGLRPGLNSSFYFGLLARPMPAAAFAAVTEAQRWEFLALLAALPG